MSDPQSLERALGRLEGKLDGINNSLSALQQALLEDRRASAAARASMSERIDHLEEQGADQNRRLSSIETSVKEDIVPFVEKSRRREQWIAGAAAAIGAVISFAVSWAWAAWDRIFPPPGG